MEELLILLNNYEKDGTSTEQIQAIACSVLIEEDGHPAWDAMNTLSSKGYYVFPVERDRFGWVLGAIETSRGIIIYG